MELNRRRATPCKECRKQRRKCVWQTNSKTCDRCHRLDRKCLSISNSLDSKSESSSTEEEEEENQAPNDKNLDEMYDQVIQLEKSIRNLEIELDQRKSAKAYMSPISLVSESDFDDDDSSVKSNQLELFERDNTIANSSHSTSHQPQYEWKLGIVNGRLQLLSDISDYDELMMYITASMKYLSPFGTSFHTTSILFQTKTQDAFMPRMLKIMSSAVPTRDRKTTVPTEFMLNPRPMIDILVNSYFRCVNPYFPLVHEPTFREYYKKLVDPLSSPITTAICATMSSTQCGHLNMPYTLKRRLSDYFYQHSKDSIGEIFDDPNRRMETVIAANLLAEFSLNMMRPREAKNLISLSLIICNDLMSHYSAPGRTSLERALFNRHYNAANILRRVVTYIVERKVEEKRFKPVPLYPMSGESDMTLEYLDVFNRVLCWNDNPCVTYILNQVRKVEMGAVGELNIEHILEFERIVKEWWEELPEKFKICENPFGHDAEKAIKSSQIEIQLMVMTFYHFFLFEVYSCLVQPKFVNSQSVDNPNQNIINLIQERAVSRLLKSAHLLIKAAKEIRKRDILCFFTTEFIFRLVDTVLMLTEFPKKDVSLEADRILRESLKEMYNMSDLCHDIKSVYRKPFKLLASESDENIVRLYDSFSNPRLVLMYDMMTSMTEELNI
ncbi:hypothetical protein CLU79DRAFT_745373 [Phycomyces nitens]|nr:hypothetical protein CLU79DRAFT_745373 [Phycomyces nitens]